MLFVPAVVLAALVVFGIIYRVLTGKPFIVFDDGKPKLWEAQPDDDVVSCVTLESIEGL